MQCLYIRVAPVLRVTTPVVLQASAFVKRIERAADVRARRLARGWSLRRLVDVISKVKHEVEVVALRDACVGIEITRVELGA